MWDPQERVFAERIERLDESPQATSPELSEEYFQYTHEMNAVGQEREQRYQEIVTKWLALQGVL